IHQCYLRGPVIPTVRRLLVLKIVAFCKFTRLLLREKRRTHVRESIRVRVVLTILFLFLTSSKSIDYAHQTRLWDIPPATKQGTPDEVKWWHGVQAAGRDLALARAKKDEAYANAVKSYYANHQNPLPDDERKIFQKEELAVLDAS